MIPFTQNRSKHKHLTVKALRADKTGTMIGFWRYDSVIHQRKRTFYISKDETTQKYVVVCATPFQIISSTGTLEDAVNALNNFVGRAQTHDVSVILNQHNKAKLVIGR